MNQMQGTRRKEPEARNQKPGTKDNEQGTRNQEPGTRNHIKYEIFSLFLFEKITQFHFNFY